MAKDERDKPSVTGSANDDKDGHPPVVMALAPPVIDNLFPATVFRTLDCDVRYANSIAEARIIAKDDIVDIALLPLDVNGRSVLPLVRELMKRNIEQAIIVVPQSNQINDAAEAMRLGAMDCLFVPFTPTRLEKTVGQVLQKIGAGGKGRSRAKTTSKPPPREANQKSSGSVHTKPVDPYWMRHGMVLSDLSMKPVLHALDTVAASDAPIYIHGETGTGKEVLARALHAESSRATGPFVVVDCARLEPDNLTRQVFADSGHGTQGVASTVDGGTLFLDEIARTDLRVQEQLMRFLESGDITPLGNVDASKVDARIICTSTEDARAEIEAGRLREDLYYRLHVVPISLPALRDRGDDILAIANTKLIQTARKEGRRFRGFTPSAADILMSHRWPGNIRQLTNVIWNIVLHHDGDMVTTDMLPVDLLAGLAEPVDATGRQQVLAETGLLGRPLAEIERIVIEETIRAQGGSIPQAAQVLQLSPSTIYRKREGWVRK
ncbi:sigma-54-dependent Fis family transcriptional regulator [Aliiroseovarius sp. Z3]|uniref:sigma-54-dependent transcriptional regulator n=1 Tax=Aliiroseovarius sp. Z3 TaxID=2811402 RepID=UPI0023B2BE25|nr:sigma-54 dependent transcriptional regulator [Aliiroseovarius sp. Z3]MDE9450968.1 sigma-54-dependent Fis family transcriptional regulator [Aliiroseovarius sp. Z3]